MAMKDVSAAAKALKTLRERAGLSVREVAQHLGFATGSGYQHYEDRFKKPFLPLDLIGKLAPLFTQRGITAAEMYALSGTTPPKEVGRAPGSAVAAEAELAPMKIESLVGNKDLPVYASAQGGSTGMVVQYEPIEWVKRPEPLFSVNNGFAIYVVGESMEPVHEQGDMLLIHPTRPPRRGQDVLIVTTDRQGTSHSALVKRFITMDDKRLRVLQFNPRKEFDLPREDIHAVHTVVGKYNRR